MTNPKKINKIKGNPKKPPQVSKDEQLEILATLIRDEPGDVEDRDRLAAMRLRSQMLGELTQKHEVTGKDGEAIRTVAELSLGEIQKLLSGK